MTAEIKTDIKMLVECMKCHVDSPATMKQALLTLSSIFSDCKEDVKEYFRHLGGLEFVMSLVTSVGDVEVKETALFCLGCAVGNNIFSQKTLTTTVVYVYLHHILSSPCATARYKQAATFLLLSLVSNNGEGQAMAKKCFCLSDLLELLRTAVPRGYDSADQGRQSWFDNAGTTSLELWTSVASALCICLNNPQNEENQKVCGFALPFIFTLLSEKTVTEIQRPLVLLVRFIVADNRCNQGKVRRCDGLQVLSSCLNDCLSDVKSQDPVHYKEAIHIITTIDSCIADNCENAEIIGQLGSIHLMMKMIKLENITTADKLKVVVSLGHAVEHCERNRNILNQNDGLQCLIQLLTSTEDEEFTRAVKYVLQLCITKENEKENSCQVLQENTDAKRVEENLLLEKITQISDQLKSIEEQTMTHYLELVHTDQDHQDDHHIAATNKSRTKKANSQQHEDTSRGSYCLISSPSDRITSHQSCQGLSSWDNKGDKQCSTRDGMRPKSMDLTERDWIPDQKQQFGYGILETLSRLLHKSPVNQVSATGDCTFVPGVSHNSSDPLNNVDHSKSSSVPYTVQQSMQNPSIQRASVPQYQHLHQAQQNSTYMEKTANFHSTHSPHVNRNSKFQFNDGLLHDGALGGSHIDPNKGMAPPYVEEDYNMTGAEGDNFVQQERAPSPAFPHRYDCQPRDVVQRKNISHHITPEVDFHCCCDRPDTFTRPVPCTTPHCLGNCPCVDMVKQTSHRTPGTSRYTETGNKSLTCQSGLNKVVQSKPHKTPTSATAVQDIKRTSRETAVSKRLDDSENMFVKPGAAPPRGVRQGLVIRRARSLGSTERLGGHKLKMFRDDFLLNQSDITSCLDTQSEFDCELMAKAEKHRKECSENSKDDKDSKRYGWQKKNTPSRTGSALNFLSASPGFYHTRSPSVTPVKGLSVRSKTWTPSQQNIQSNRQLFQDNDSSSVRKCPKLDSTPKYSVKPVYEVCPSPALSQKCIKPISGDDASIEETAPSDGREISAQSPNKRFQGCVGCTGTTACGDTLLNSRTINIVLETSPYTCKHHRRQREAERRFIHHIRKSDPARQKPTVYTGAWDKDRKRLNKKKDVYNINMDSDLNDYLSPPNSEIQKGLDILSEARSRETRNTHHRPRVPYSEEEVNNLIHGVKTLGKFWNQILLTYKFDPSRTAVDLKDKYRGLQKQKNSDFQKSPGKTISIPFSMCEERRLLKGVKEYGYNWRSILKSFVFHKDRTAVDLRNKWRSMHKRITSKTRSTVY